MNENSAADVAALDKEIARLADETNAGLDSGELIEVRLPDGRLVVRRAE